MMNLIIKSEELRKESMEILEEFEGLRVELQAIGDAEVGKEMLERCEALIKRGEEIEEELGLINSLIQKKIDLMKGLS